MLPDLALTIGGFALLIWGADRFVVGAGGTASLLGVPPIIVGLTIVGFATSAPEMLVSMSAAANGLTGMAVGNAIGSNIANIGLVLGAAAIITPIRGELSPMLRTELPMLLVITLAAFLLFLDASLDRRDGVILLVGITVFLGWVVRNGRRLKASDPMVAEAIQEVPRDIGRGRAIGLLLIGFAALVGGSELLVTGAENLALRLGVSDLVIGLTIVAIGTSLPELAVSVVSAVKGQPDLAVGNVIGSNVFNLLAVIGVAGVVGPAPLDPHILSVHYPLMLGFTCVLLLLAYNPLGKPGISRALGFSLLAAFMGYQAMLLSGSL